MTTCQHHSLSSVYASESASSASATLRLGCSRQWCSTSLVFKGEGRQQRVDYGRSSADQWVSQECCQACATLPCRTAHLVRCRRARTSDSTRR